MYSLAPSNQTSAVLHCAFNLLRGLPQCSYKEDSRACVMCWWGGGGEGGGDFRDERGVCVCGGGGSGKQKIARQAVHNLKCKLHARG